VKRANLERKIASSLPASTVSIPRLLCDEDEHISEAVSSAKLDLAAVPAPATPETYQHWKKGESHFSSRQTGPWVVVGNVEAAHPPNQLSVEDEARACFNIVEGATVFVH
jgi:hypothetical protein